VDRGGPATAGVGQVAPEIGPRPLLPRTPPASIGWRQVGSTLGTPVAPRRRQGGGAWRFAGPPASHTDRSLRTRRLKPRQQEHQAHLRGLPAPHRSAGFCLWAWGVVEGRPSSIRIAEVEFRNGFVLPMGQINGRYRHIVSHVQRQSRLPNAPRHVPADQLVTGHMAGATMICRWPRSATAGEGGTRRRRLLAWARSA
jgi:hypothetical protein